MGAAHGGLLAASRPHTAAGVRADGKGQSRWHPTTQRLAGVHHEDALEELGIDPGELPSPLVAAGASLASFALGALVPLLGYPADVDVLGVALGLAAVAAVAGGGMVARLTGRAFWRGALRQLVLGGCAAGVTYLIGIGVGHIIG